VNVCGADLEHVRAAVWRNNLERKRRRVTPANIAHSGEQKIADEMQANLAVQTSRCASCYQLLHCCLHPVLFFLDVVKLACVDDEPAAIPLFAVG
jgi:hypothetical protein